MYCLKLTVLSLAAICVSAEPLRAEFLMLTIATDKSEYSLGEIVNWNVRVDVGNSTAATNFGIAQISLNLRDSTGTLLTPGTINANAPPSGFGAYASSGGTFNPATQTLLEIGGTLFQQNNFLVVGNHSGSMTNLLFAQGSYVATTPGAHSLIGTPGSANSFFTAANQQVGAAGAAGLYSPVTFANANFIVTAVPEPSSALLVATLGLGAICRFRRKAIGLLQAGWLNACTLDVDA